MKHTFFEISNFKGIQDLRIDFDSAPSSRVITLVGLNESGKTTILEAVNFYTPKPQPLRSLNITGYRIQDPHDAIPISRRSNFTDSIKITAGYELSPAEQHEFAELLAKNLKLIPSSPLQRFRLTQTHHFKDSKYDKRSAHYSEIPRLRTPRGKKFRSASEFPEAWPKIDSWLAQRLPRVVYFPNFLFEIPEHIYLDTAPSDEPIHSFYRDLLQHILHAVDPGLDIKKHLIARAKSTDLNDVRSLRSVLSKLGGHVTKTVFDAWDRIFNRKHVAKEIVFEIDKDSKGLVFLQFQIKDGDDLFAITERSLGFRWFFTFLLLTQYQSRAGANVEGQLFLFDEPASNLHSSAQQQLLDSFQRFHPESRIMYTTHSHHLINPRWLESAYVVVNEGLTYDDEAAYSTRESKVVVQRYRKFAAVHPDQTTYFQPILDVLEYRPSNLELALDAVFFEGKNDSYAMALAALQLGIDISQICFMPGTSSSNLRTPIQLYLGWGRKFVVILDADKEGYAQKRRYEVEFGKAVEGRILCLDDLDPTMKNCRLEDVVPATERRAIQERCYPDSKAGKDQYNRALQELLQLGEKDVFHESTALKFKLLIEGILGVMKT